MTSTPLRYVHVAPSGRLPEFPANGPSRAVIVVEAAVAEERRREVSRWLVGGNCLYAMAWGRDASSWDDSIDLAGFERDAGLSDERLVMTTWHDDEALDEVFVFCASHANHPHVALQTTVVVHVAERADGPRLLGVAARRDPARR